MIQIATQHERIYNKADVLAALFNRSKQQGLGFLHTEGATDIDAVGAQEIIDEMGLKFDYLRGRVMKVKLDTDELQPWLYDWNNGVGAAASALSGLRAD